MFSNFKSMAGAAVLLLALSSVCSATIIYTFDDLATGTVAPFSDTQNGLTATFSTTGAVCNVSALGFSLQSGNALISNYCVTGQASSPIDVAFSSPLTDISMDFALSNPTTITLTAFMGGNEVGTVSSSGSIGGYPEGVIEFSGVQFDSLRLSTPNVAMSIDNMAAVGTPEPSSLILIGGAALPLVVLRIRRRKLIR